MELSDQVAVVTGASSGIGEATARALAKDGANVVLAARRADRLENIAQNLGNDTALAVPTDVTDKAEITAMVDRAVKEFGGIDILVNSAGVISLDTVAEADPGDFRQQVEVNLLGLMNVTHEVLPKLLEGGGGDIVAVSSVGAQTSTRGYSAYAATKAGVNAFCRVLRREVAEDGIRVSVMMPGAVDTEIMDGEDILSLFDPSDLAETVLDPEDVAEAILFAVTRPDRASSMTHTLIESPPSTLYR